jgi:23S rRNA pseudouridine2605 synthase
MAGKENPSAPRAASRGPAKAYVKPEAAAQRAPDKDTPEGERIAKVLSRRGVASRREAERLIEAGEVTVNGKTITSAALNVTPRDRITISGHNLPAEEPARLWLYYKPEGLVTSEADEKGRDTVFANLPEEMPRVMSIGRLDLNSEGLLLLTNDGALKRKLELPSTGWLRKYRVRVNGNPTDVDLEPLRKGITVEGERFQPMIVTLDRIQGANAWITVGLREGKNREIRRALNAIDLYVNRLIRVSYGPFRLGELQPGEVEEVRAKVLRDQLGDEAPSEPEEDRAPVRSARPGTKPGGAARKLPAGQGLRHLSDTFQKALKPEGEARARVVVKRSTAKPYERSEEDRGPAASKPRAAGKPSGKPSGKPARSDAPGEVYRKAAAKAAKSSPAAPRKPVGPKPAAPRKPAAPKGRG